MESCISRAPQTEGVHNYVEGSHWCEQNGDPIPSEQAHDLVEWKGSRLELELRCHVMYYFHYSLHITFILIL